VAEQQTIELAKQGDSTALAQLLQEHYPFVVKYLLKITFDSHLAEDLAQETMVRCIHKIHLYNRQYKFSSWLITLATRIHIDELRKRKREKKLLDQELVLRKIKWQVSSLGEEWPDVLDALHGLSADARMAIVLKHYYGYSLEEIAEMMAIPVGTVKSRVHNGIQSMRKEFGEDDKARRALGGGAKP
jgi:RNA polymerase sigma-70 factor (ECF subfamily)